MSHKSSTQKRRRKVGRLAGSGIEPLEQRLLFSTVSWVGGSGSWSTGSNWSSGSVPTSANIVVINQPGNIQVTLNGSASVGSLSVTGDTLVVSNGTLSIATNSSLNAASSLTLTGATLTTAAGATLTNSGSISVSTGSDLNVGGAYSQSTTGVLTLASGSVSSGIGVNLVGDGDFEAPSAGGSSTMVPNVWGDWGPPTGASYVSTQFAFTGSQSLLQNGANSGVNQSFSITPGVSYTTSVYAMTPSTAKLTGPEGGFVNIFFYDSNGNQLTGSTGITALSSTSAAGGPLTGSVGGQGWNLFTFSAVAPTNAVKATLALQVGTYTGHSGTAGGSVYWDNAQFGPTGHTSALFNAAGVSNSGTITDGVGDNVNDTGTFTQSSTGTFNTLLGGPAASLLFGSVTGTGTASLAGKLTATLAGGYTPTLGDAFNLVTYSGATGTFSTVQVPSGASYAFQSSVGPFDVGISALPLSLSTTVNIGTVIDPVPTNVVGVNIDWWDNQLNTAQTEQMVEAAGLNLFRFPGGSSSDDFHFNVSDNYATGETTTPQFAEFIQAVGGTGLVTTDYGSGSPQEAEAELAYLDGSTTDTTVIGTGIQWNDSTGAWQNVNWQTVGYWASLRAAAPLGDSNDPIDFLRINHPAPFSNITYWEIGNEEYGSWEIDHHGTAGPGGVSTGLQRDPATYAKFAGAFAAFVAADKASNFPTLHIGIDSGDPTGASDNNWTKNVLAAGESIGFVPGFISDHNYVQGPGSESDSFLLNDTVSNVGSTLSWSTRHSDYETMLQQTVGSNAAAGVQIMATEFNSNYGTPGKQMTSIVNGLFIADSIGSLMDTGYTSGLVWDLRNGWGTTGNNSPTLYGWRQGGDEGLLGSSNVNSTPSTGAYVPYPNYFAEELGSKIVQSGGMVVSAVSNYNEMAVYTVLEANGHLDLMVINKNPDANITEQFSLPGFNASGQAQIWQYGEAQDYAQSLTSNGAASLANLTTTLSFTGSNFSYMFPAYSMTVIDLTPTPVVVNAAAADSNPVSGISTDLSALGSENGNSSGLTYTWSATGPASVLYTGNTNGTNAAANITAQFSMAGSYNFTVTIADAEGGSTTSSVAVNVQQTPTSVTVTPSTVTVAPGGQEQFAATVYDQFGNPQSAHPILWSVSNPGSNGNSISGTGLATFGSTPSIYTVTAGFGFASGNATVTVGVAPVVSTFQVNDGNAQRSMVDSLTVTFNEPVTLSTGAISLNLLAQTGGASTPMAFTLTPNSGSSTTWVLTFIGSSYIGGSLPDGAYELIVSASGVASGQGLNMSTTQDFTFWRLYGDFAGDGTVNGSDFTQLVTLIGKSTNSSNWYVDYDDDGVIGGSDFTAFVTRLGHSISIPSLPSVVLLTAASPASSTAAQHTNSAIVAAVTTPLGKKKPRHGHG
jgi:hypothetical protein